MDVQPFPMVSFTRGVYLCIDKLINRNICSLPELKLCFWCSLLPCLRSPAWLPSLLLPLHFWLSMNICCEIAKSRSKLVFNSSTQLPVLTLFQFSSAFIPVTSALMMTHFYVCPFHTYLKKSWFPCIGSLYVPLPFSFPQALLTLHSVDIHHLQHDTTIGHILLFQHIMGIISSVMSLPLLS